MSDFGTLGTPEDSAISDVGTIGTQYLKMTRTRE